VTQKNGGMRIMPKWIETYENHRIHKVTTDSINFIKGLIEEGAPLPQHLEDFQKIQAIFLRLSLLLNDFDPFLWNTNFNIDTVTDNVNNTVAQLNAYKDNKSQDYINNAISYTNNVIANYPNFHSAKVPSLRGVRETSVEYQREVSKYIEKIQEKYEQISANFNESTEAFEEISVTITEKINIFDSLIDDLNEKFEEEVSQRLQEFNNTQNERSNLYSQEADHRQTTFLCKLEEFNTKFEVTIKEISKYKEDLRESMKNDVLAIVDEIRDLRKEAQNLVNGVASDTMAKGYKSMADEERKIKFIWNTGALVSMIALFGFSLYTFKSISNENMTWFTFIAKIFTTATIGTIVAYCANQANKYHRSEQFNRRMHLELHAISPYIEGLNYDDKNAIKARLADRFFGVQDQINDSTEPNNKQNNLSPEMVKQIIELIKSMKGNS
jgi:hypothetical protein